MTGGFSEGFHCCCYLTLYIFSGSSGMTQKKQEKMEQYLFTVRFKRGVHVTDEQVYVPYQR